MTYLCTGEEHLFSVFRNIEIIYLDATEDGYTLEEALNSKVFSVPSEMMAIDALVEYGWERAINIALNDDAETVKLLMPQELCSYAGEKIVTDLKEILKAFRKSKKIGDKKLLEFLKWMYELPEETKYDFGNVPEINNYWEIVSLYEIYSLKDSELQ